MRKDKEAAKTLYEVLRLKDLKTMKNLWWYSMGHINFGEGRS